MQNYKALIEFAVTSQQEVSVTRNNDNSQGDTRTSGAGIRPAPPVTRICASQDSWTKRPEDVAPLPTPPQKAEGQQASAEQPSLSQVHIPQGGASSPQGSIRILDLTEGLRQEASQMQALASHRAALRRLQTEQRNMEMETAIRAAHFSLAGSPIHPLVKRRPMPMLRQSIALPDDLRRCASYLCTNTDQDANSAALSLLACISIAMRGRYEAVLDDDWREPMIVYALLLDESGRRKSQSVGKLRAPFDAFISPLQKDYAESASRRLAQDKAARKVAERLALQAAKQEAKEQTPVEGALTAEHIRTIARRFAEIQSDACAPMAKRRAYPRLHADSGTLRQLAFAQAEQGECLSFLEAEGGLLIDCLAKKEMDCTLLLKSFTMESYSYESATLGAVHLSRPAMPMLFFVQHAVLARLFKNETLVERGALARFILYFCSQQYSAHNSPMETNLSQDPELAKKAYSLYCDKVMSLLARTYTQDPDREIHKVHVTLGAHRLIKAFEAEVRASLSHENNPLLEPFLRKLHGTAVRLAGCVHAWNCALPQAHPITEQEMQAGIDLARLLTEHARTAFDVAGEEALRNAHKILEWVKRVNFWSADPHFTSREAEQGVRGLTKMTSHPALDLLEEHNMIRQILVPGRSRICVVNPRIFSVTVSQ